MVNVLFVCSANMERSPTAEQVFRDMPRWEVKSAGTENNAVNKISQKLVQWADKIVLMEDYHLEVLNERFRDFHDKAYVLDVEDRYYRCSPELIGVLIQRMSHIFVLDEWCKNKFGCK